MPRLSPVPPGSRRLRTRRLLVSVLVFLAWATTGIPSPAGERVPRRLRRLAEALPPCGQVVSMADLGISAGPEPGTVPMVAGGYNFRAPADLDRRSTTAPPYEGRYPDLHLNQPLRIVPRDVHRLFLSDQPEEIRDDRLREDGTRGVVGIYARSRVAAAAPTRILVDHTNGTKRRLRYLLLLLPGGDGAAMVARRGQQALQDPVLAAMKAFTGFHRVAFEPNVAVRRGQPVSLVDTEMAPGHTFSAQLEFNSTAPGELCSLVLEAGTPAPRTRAELDRLPILHSILWGEEAERLKKFVNPERQPTRYRRILGAYQHARGIFPYPDREATLTYRVADWDDASAPVRAFSFFESIPGHDATMPALPATDNRGRYGAVTAAVFDFQRLPAGCREVALVMLNPYATFGGRHLVTDTRTLAVETVMLPRQAPGLLESGKACTLWRGPMPPGGRLVLTSEPLANTSVYPWYLVVPLPPAPRPR